MPQGRAVGGRQRGELIVREGGSGHVVRPFRRRGHVLGIAAVAFAPHQAHRVGVRAFGVVDRRVDDHAAAHEALVHVGTDRHDMARHIGALDARETDRPPPARQRLRVSGPTVRTLSGPQVGVVQRHRGDPHQYLSRLRRGHGHLCQFEDLRPPVLRDPHRAHGLGHTLHR
ncbi:hypothetical protein GCM10020227_41000 [Streptomyces flavovirens]